MGCRCSRRKTILLTRLENKVIAQEGLRLANSTRVTGDISLEGDARHNAGSNIDCGKFSGKWHVNDVKHEINKSQDWVSWLSIRKIN
jgi:hypothetical protein